MILRAEALRARELPLRQVTVRVTVRRHFSSAPPPQFDLQRRITPIQDMKFPIKIGPRFIRPCEFAPPSFVRFRIARKVAALYARKPPDEQGDDLLKIAKDCTHMYESALTPGLQAAANASLPLGFPIRRFDGSEKLRGRPHA